MKHEKIQKVSVHGGHSGQFCQHARDSLEAVVQAYIAQGFTWVGITEHMPPAVDAFRYPDEAEAGLSAILLQERFIHYFDEVRRLRDKYAGQITLYCSFETEMYEGALPFIGQLADRCRPDYLVGSVHHVRGIGIDYNAQDFARAAECCGGMEALYCEYFDAQFELLQALAPAVVGHFDLIRKFDPDYRETLALPAVCERINRNLDFIADKGLILDFNLRGYSRSTEPYPSLAILKQAAARDISVVPGDDSHGVASVGLHWDEGLAVLASCGIGTDWKLPA